MALKVIETVPGGETEGADTTPEALLARIQTLEAEVASLKQEMPKDKATIVVFSGDFDRLIAAFIIASGAAAMGTEVNLFFTFWGLHALRKARTFRNKTLPEKMLSAMLPVGPGGTSKMNMLGIGPKFFQYIMKQRNVETLDDLTETAKDLEVRLVACQMSMGIMGISEDELMEGISFGGVAAYLGDACESRVTLFI